jgi:hypothetical protein
MEIHRRTGLKPVVITSSEYVDIYEGVSYVKPHSLPEHWYKMVPHAKQIAQELFGGGDVVQFWHQPPVGGDEISANEHAFATLQCHGFNHGVNMALDPNYGTSMARRCGFSQEEWRRLPLIFDRRNTFRESALAKTTFGPEKRPILLYNFVGISSPFPYVPEVLNGLMLKFGRKYRLVDLGKVRGHRIFDLFGLYDKAVGLITSDTATAHLAVGAKLPAIWFTVDGWTGSVPRGNVAFACRYSQAMESLEKVWSVVDSWHV